MAMLKQVCGNNKIRLTDILGNQIAKHSRLMFHFNWYYGLVYLL